MSQGHDSSAARGIIYLKPRLAVSPGLVSLPAAGWQLLTVGCAQQALELLEREHLPVGLACLDLPEEALQSCEPLFNRSPQTQWIALVPPPRLGDPQVARLIGEGCYDYHTLPEDPQRLLATIGHAYGMATLRGRSEAASAVGETEMVGNTAVMRNLFRAIRKVAGVEASVLITGESGTGKELTARAIHERSARASGPFVALNCGALPASLVQSELFGHEKGAFTGASQRRLGRIEAARGGTLFLDEIGDLPLELQANLLRFLQEGTIERVGGTGVQHVDVRVISATHVDLQAAVEAGRFREDLYYRLHVLEIRVPALRERGEDIELLARYFFERFADHRRQELRGFSQQALHLIRAHDWPGNVREMINRIRRAMVMSEHRLITPADLGLERRHSRRRQLLPLAEVRDHAERQAIRHALGDSRNNVSEAARSLGVSRVTLYRLMARHGLQLQE